MDQKQINEFIGEMAVEIKLLKIEFQMMKDFKHDLQESLQLKMLTIKDKDKQIEELSKMLADKTKFADTAKTCNEKLMIRINQKNLQIEELEERCSCKFECKSLK